MLRERAKSCGNTQDVGVVWFAMMPPAAGVWAKSMAETPNDRPSPSVPRQSLGVLHHLAAAESTVSQESRSIDLPKVRKTSFEVQRVRATAIACVESDARKCQNGSFKFNEAFEGSILR